MFRNEVDVSDMEGKVFTKVSMINSDTITFEYDGGYYTMFHRQDCCEIVQVEDIEGSLDFLVGTPILSAYESSNSGEESMYESSTWTFYRFSTAKGHVVIRWLGESNGYYSESVDVERYSATL